MAVRARRFSRLRNELTTVPVGVAFLADLWSPLKLCFSRTGHRFVARTTGNRSMGPQQRELRLVVVESIDISPRLCVVTSFAAKWTALRPVPRHAVAKLAVMRVLVTKRAAAVFKSERQYFVRAMCHLRFVAIVARDNHMCAGQGIFGISMLCDREE